MVKSTKSIKRKQRLGLPSALILAVLLVVSSSCSGNARRESLVDQLRLVFSEVPPLVHPGKHFEFATAIENRSPSPVDVCITHEVVGLRSPDGKSSPVTLSVSFDRGCVHRVRLQPHSTESFPQDGFIFPAVAVGSSTLFAKIRLFIELGQLYWPSDLYSLSAADQPISVGLSSSPAEGLTPNPLRRAAIRIVTSVRAAQLSRSSGRPWHSSALAALAPLVGVAPRNDGCLSAARLPPNPLGDTNNRRGQFPCWQRSERSPSCSSAWCLRALKQLLQPFRSCGNTSP